MAVTFTPGTDFEDITDGLERVDVTQRDSEVWNVKHALRRAIGHTEPEETQGDVRQSDTIWHLPYDEMRHRPDMGALVSSLDWEAEDQTWVVLSVAHQTLSRRWRCVCRALDVRNTLETLVTIQVVTYTKGIHGETVETWSDDETDVRAKIQELDTSPAMQHSAWNDTVGFRIFFEEHQALGRLYRIVDRSDNIYRILRVSQGYSLGAVQAVDAEKMI